MFIMYTHMCGSCLLCIHIGVAHVYYVYIYVIMYTSNIYLLCMYMGLLYVYTRKQYVHTFIIYIYYMLTYISDIYIYKSIIQL